MNTKIFQKEKLIGHCR